MKPKPRARENSTGSRPRTRGWLRFGPGTVIAVVAAAAIAGSGQFQRTTGSDSGRIIYEADSDGKLQKVERPSRSIRPSVPALWKPEPGLLLRRSPGLDLTATQRKGITELERAWQAERAAIVKEIETAAKGFGERTSSGSNLTTTMIATRLEDYSALSRRLNERREDYWQDAVALLTPAQRVRVLDLAPLGGTRG